MVVLPRGSVKDVELIRPQQIGQSFHSWVEVIRSSKIFVLSKFSPKISKKNYQVKTGNLKIDFEISERIYCKSYLVRIRIGAGSSEIVETEEIESSNEQFGFGRTEIISGVIFRAFVKK